MLSLTAAFYRAIHNFFDQRIGVNFARFFLWKITFRGILMDNLGIFFSAEKKEKNSGMYW
jgi:hypothetical protein